MLILYSSLLSIKAHRRGKCDVRLPLLNLITVRADFVRGQNCFTKYTSNLLSKTICDSES